jgi:hypothetical protein
MLRKCQEKNVRRVEKWSTIFSRSASRIDSRIEISPSSEEKLGLGCRIRKPCATSKISSACPRRAASSACLDAIRNHSRWASATPHMRATGLQHQLPPAAAHRSTDPTCHHKGRLRTFDRVARLSPAPQDFIKAGANIEPNVRHFDGPHHHTLNLIDQIRIQRTGLDVTKVFRLLFALGRPRRPTIPS